MSAETFRDPWGIPHLRADTADELAFLQEQLEEESLTDTDYYLRKETIEEFASSADATEHLVNLLRAALHNDDALEIRWERAA